MEEDEYRSTYNELASVRCVFEKALTNNRARCCLAKHFCLADREGYACSELESSVTCREFLKTLREKSIFVLKINEIKGALPHNMEIRVQAGGLYGLAKSLGIQTNESVTPPMIDDIHQLIKKMAGNIGTADKLPYSEIIQSVLRFKGRRRQSRS